MRSNKADSSKVAKPPVWALTAPPQEISFIVPADFDLSARQPICVQGPHGPLELPVPEGAVPGEPCYVRLGPPAMYKVNVPEGSSPGDTVRFAAATPDAGTGSVAPAALIEAVVPEGKAPGDVFEVFPPALLVQVPEGTQPGDPLVFHSPDNKELVAAVPEGLAPGRYFSVHLPRPSLSVGPVGGA